MKGILICLTYSNGKFYFRRQSVKKSYRIVGSAIKNSSQVLSGRFRF